MNISDTPACLYGYNGSKWPIRCLGKLDFSVNSGHGGCAALYFNSCSYGGKGEDTTAEIFIVNCGFDCNHYSYKSIVKSNSGHFGAENGLCTDEKGMLIGSCMFGNNHLMLMTNDYNSTTLSHGIFIETVYPGPANLPVNVNGPEGDKGKGGLTLVLCSGMEGGIVCNSLYMIRSGFKDNKFQQKIISGEDKFKFDVDEDGVLNVTGSGKCSYGIFYNRGMSPSSSRALVTLTQALDGKESEILFENIQGYASLIVLCSNSNGTEDSTAATSYFISVGNSQILEVKEIAGQHGPSYDKSDLWNFEIVAGQLLVSGPVGPCRYAVLSNFKDGEAVQGVQNQDGCLATGEPTKLEGQVKITLTGVEGFVDKTSRIVIKLDHKIVETFKPEDLQKEKGTWKFSRKWTEEERCVGIQLIRVYAVRKHLKSRYYFLAFRFYYPPTFQRKSRDIVIPPSVRPSVMSHHCSQTI